MAEAKGGNTPGVQNPGSTWSDSSDYSAPVSTESAKSMIEKRASEARSATDK